MGRPPNSERVWNARSRHLHRRSKSYIQMGLTGTLLWGESLAMILPCKKQLKSLVLPRNASLLEDLKLILVAWEERKEKAKLVNYGQWAKSYLWSGTVFCKEHFIRTQSHSVICMFSMAVIRVELMAEETIWFFTESVRWSLPGGIKYKCEIYIMKDIWKSLN